MRKLILSLLVICMPFFMFGNDDVPTIDNSTWMLDSSTLSYKISFPLHHPVGETREATGFGSCSTDGCLFVVSAPIKSFDSKNEKRDHDMIETMRGETFPLVKVAASFPMFPAEGQLFKANLLIEMSGEVVKYPDVEFKVVMNKENSLQVTGTIPMQLEDFKVKRPSLAGIKVKNLCPIKVDVLWKKDLMTAVAGEVK